MTIRPRPPGRGEIAQRIHAAPPMSASKITAVAIGHKPLWEFQKWAIRRYYELMPFEQFDNSATQRARDQIDLFAEPAG